MKYALIAFAIAFGSCQSTDKGTQSQLDRCIAGYSRANANTTAAITEAERSIAMIIQRDSIIDSLQNIIKQHAYSKR